MRLSRVWYLLLVLGCAVGSAMSAAAPRVTFVRLGQPQLGLWSADPGSGAVAVAVPSAGQYLSHARISPQGGLAAFSAGPTDVDIELYVMHLDGTGRRNITSSVGLDWRPEWSPNGSRIAFASTRDSQWPASRLTDIYTMNADGSDVRRLTTHLTEDMTPAWSPDGQQIVFATERDSPDPKFIVEIEVYVMDADGGNKRNLTQHADLEYEPDWSPDGTQIAFAAGDGRIKDPDIHLISVDGTGRRRLTTHFAMDTAPAWSPDGAQIAFQSSRDGPPGIYVMDADGANIRRLTGSRHGDISPDWYNPNRATSVSPLAKRPLTWGWMKQLGRARR